MFAGWIWIKIVCPHRILLISWLPVAERVYKVCVSNSARDWRGVVKTECHYTPNWQWGSLCYTWRIALFTGGSALFPPHMWMGKRHLGQLLLPMLISDNGWGLSLSQLLPDVLDKLIYPHILKSRNALINSNRLPPIPHWWWSHYTFFVCFLVPQQHSFFLNPPLSTKLVH